ncbi:hypothetical protein D3C77_324360 [compost metagenome]
MTSAAALTLISPQIILRKSSSRASATRGDTFSYELQIENKNPFEVDGILYDVLPTVALVLANYTYSLNDKVYRDEVRSNEYELWIDDPYE